MSVLDTIIGLRNEFNREDASIGLFSNRLRAKFN